MVADLGLLDTAVAPTVRRPVLTVAVDGDADALAGTVVAADIELVTSPGVDRCTVTVAASAPVAVGATVSVSADAGDGDEAGVVTGRVAAVRRGATGVVVVEVADASVALATLRIDQSYEQQTAAEIARDLCGAAGVDVGEVSDGARYPFVAIDAARSVWRQLGRLAAHDGLLVGVDADGAVWLAAPAPEDIAGAFAYGVDVLDAEIVAREARAVAGIVGEGAAGSQGADAWAWPVRDPTPVRADLDAPARGDGALRTPEAVTAAAAAAVARTTQRMTLTVPLAPALRPGRGVAVSGLPGLSSAATVMRVRHRWRAGTPPTTRVEADLPAGAGLDR